jgi:hypothetical protein
MTQALYAHMNNKIKKKKKNSTVKPSFNKLSINKLLQLKKKKIFVLEVSDYSRLTTLTWNRGGSIWGNKATHLMARK